MSDEPDAITFVNRFTVHGAPEEFERAFAQTAEVLRGQPGLVQYTLLRHVDRSDSYINIAQWRDAASLRRAVQHPEFAAHVTALRAVSTSEPNTYAPRQTYLAAVGA
jgi:monooxygenase